MYSINFFNLYLFTHTVLHVDRQRYVKQTKILAKSKSPKEALKHNKSEFPTRCPGLGQSAYTPKLRLPPSCPIIGWQLGDRNNKEERRDAASAKPS